MSVARSFGLKALSQKWHLATIVFCVSIFVTQCWSEEKDHCAFVFVFIFCTCILFALFFCASGCMKYNMWQGTIATKVTPDHYGILHFNFVNRCSVSICICIYTCICNCTWGCMKVHDCHRNDTWPRSSRLSTVEFLTPSTPFVFPTIVYHTLGPFHTYSLYNSPIPIALSFATIVLNFTLEASNMCSELYTCPNSCTPSTQVLNCTFLLPFVFARLLSCSGPRLMWSMFLQFEPWSAHSKYQLTVSPWE